MSALVELIKKIGIFMIAAQAVIHFAPDIKYAKYMKLIVGIMILLQFLSPVYRIVSGMEADWNARLSDMEQDMRSDMQIAGLSEDFTGSYSAAEVVTNSMEQEIKSKLNDILLNDNSNKKYVVTSVIVSLEASRENGENVPEYVLNKIQVAVWEHAEVTSGTERDPDAGSTDDVNDVGKVGKVQIEKIDISEDSLEEGTGAATEYREGKDADSLRKRFCNALGMDEKYMEVKVYGTSKEVVE